MFAAELSADFDRWVETAVTGYWLDAIEHWPEDHPFVAPRDPGDKSAIPGLLEDEARAGLLELARLWSRCPGVAISWPVGSDPRSAGWRDFLQKGLRHVQTFLARERRQRGARSFDDLLQEVRDALRSPKGEELAALIRSGFPAALIDEFQDTDPIQYEIFRAIYGSRHDCSVFLIGDPKQAIYAFRGADVFAYLRAKRDATQHYTLTHNFRSAPELVAAVNVLFHRSPQPFLIPGIDFHPVVPALESVSDAGLEIVWIPSPPKQSLTKQWADKHIPMLVAADILALVARKPQLGDHEVQFSSIAVLCRTNRQAALIQQGLRKAGIPSALESEASVFETPEALELELILEALLQPTSTGRVRAALATVTLGLSAEELAALDQEDASWDHWAQRFYEWGETWRRTGVLPALQEMFDELEVVQRLLVRVDGERCVTNLRHLAELLHQAATEQRLSPEELCEWLAVMRRNPAQRLSDRGLGEAAQLRLESDDAAVRIVTIHKAKGLQYPVVFCPFLWDNATPIANRFVVFHDPQTCELAVDLRHPPDAQSTARAVLEARAEARRLLYVALTRARYRCVIYWGAFTTAHESPLAGLFHPTWESSWAKSAPARSTRSKLNDEQIRDDLNTLAQASGGTIAVRRAQTGGQAVCALGPSAESAELVFSEAKRRFDEVRWQVASFSTLVQAGGDVPVPALEGFDHDPFVRPGSAAEEFSEPSDTWFGDLQSGARTGEWLHALLERLDFTRPVADQTEVLEESLRAQGAPLSANALAQALQAIVDTPLVAGWSLRDIRPERRRSELGFFLPAGCGANGAGGLKREDLAQVFARYAILPAVKEYAPEVAKLPFSRWRGFLKGYIDLVFEHQGRWYVADYKSNDLGPRSTDYTPERLVRAMTAHHYVLQYHLYVLAVHRWLQATLRGYEYKHHFGGVFYLFLRGMRPEHPPGTGVFFDRPPARLVEALAHYFTHGRCPE